MKNKMSQMEKYTRALNRLFKRVHLTVEDKDGITKREYLLLNNHTDFLVVAINRLHEKYFK